MTERLGVSEEAEIRAQELRLAWKQVAHASKLEQAGITEKARAILGDSAQSSTPINEAGVLPENQIK